MKKWIVPLMLVLLAACSSAQEPQPLPTLAQLPTTAATADSATPTTESGSVVQPTAAPTQAGITPPPEKLADTVLDVQFSGAIEGAFTHALLTFETGGHYTLIFDEPNVDYLVQLRLILAGNIEPGTYDIVPDNDFELPDGQMVAARFDLGFQAEAISGTFTLDSIGEGVYTGSLDLTAQTGVKSVHVTGSFEGLDAAIIN